MELPNRKVGSGALAGALVTVAVWIVQTATSVDVPPEVAAALVTIITLATSYWVRDPAATAALHSPPDRPPDPDPGDQ